MNAPDEPPPGADASAASPLSHLDDAGHARMVDVSGKAETVREALAEARVRMAPATLALVQDGGLAKGDVLAVARLAGIMAAKRTGDLIPLCHPLPLDGVSVEFEVEAGETGSPEVLRIRARARTRARTGVEMEAMTAASVAALTVYDMCKAAEKGIVVEAVRLLEKHGGKSGSWVRAGHPVAPAGGATP